MSTPKKVFPLCFPSFFLFSVVSIFSYLLFFRFSCNSSRSLFIYIVVDLPSFSLIARTWQHSKGKKNHHYAFFRHEWETFQDNHSQDDDWPSSASNEMIFHADINLSYEKFRFRWVKRDSWCGFRTDRPTCLRIHYSFFITTSIFIVHSVVMGGYHKSISVLDSEKLSKLPL